VSSRRGLLTLQSLKLGEVSVLLCVPYENAGNDFLLLDGDGVQQVLPDMAQCTLSRRLGGMCESTHWQSTCMVLRLQPQLYTLHTKRI
jgi:hypothetical protein